MTHFHSCVACGEEFECDVENCQADDDTAVCDDCAADENDGLTTDYIDNSEFDPDMEIE